MSRSAIRNAAMWTTLRRAATKPCLMQSPALPQLILDEVGLDPIALLQAKSE